MANCQTDLKVSLASLALLTDRTQCVSYNSTSSIVTDVKYGVPQGSVQGPSRFSLYVSTNDDESPIMKLETCLRAVKKWMSENFLLLNSDQTKMLVTDRLDRDAMLTR